MFAIQLENLNKTYKNGVNAIKDLSLTIEQGDFFGLLGPNGAGKSTTINIICSLVNKSSGMVKILGHDLDLAPDKAKSFLGVVPQEINVAVFEKVINIVVNQAGYYGTPRKKALEQAEKYLTLLHLWDKKDDIARNLSGGMKRRLMIARALVHEPAVLVLDEPTAGVDISIRHQMWEFLAALNKEGKTILLTTHYLEEVEHLCRNMAILKQGRLGENGSIKQIISKLDEETFVFDLYNEIIDHGILAAQPFFKIIDSVTLEVTISHGHKLGQAIQFLTDHNIQVRSMRNKLNRLEKFFLQVTKEEA